MKVCVKCVDIGLFKIKVPIQVPIQVQFKFNYTNKICSKVALLM